MSMSPFACIGPATRVALLSFLLTSSAASVSGAALTGSPDVEDSASIRIVYDGRLASEGYPSPALRVTVGETSAWLLIDTGAGVHTLASWFVRDAGIQGSASTVAAQDSTGREVSMRVVHDIRLKLGSGPALVIPEAAVADFPPAFQRLRIAGLLSPQLLAGPGTVSVLDLRAPSLRVTSEPGAMSARATQGERSATLCRVDSSPFRNLLFGLGASVAGVPVVLTLDTGASTTILDRSRPAAKALHDLQPDGFQTGVSGVHEPIFRSTPLAVDFGAGERKMPVRVGVPRGGCGVDGLIGMDALRSCVLSMSDRAVALTCDPAQGAAGPRRDRRAPRDHGRGARALISCPSLQNGESEDNSIERFKCGDAPHV
jgi:Aspartyl protease